MRDSERISETIQLSELSSKSCPVHHSLSYNIERDLLVRIMFRLFSRTLKHFAAINLLRREFLRNCWFPSRGECWRGGCGDCWLGGCGDFWRGGYVDFWQKCCGDLWDVSCLEVTLCIARPTKHRRPGYEK